MSWKFHHHWNPAPKQNVRKTVLSESKVIKLSVPTISAVGKPDIGDIAVVQT